MPPDLRVFGVPRANEAAEHLWYAFDMVEEMGQLALWSGFDLVALVACMPLVISRKILWRVLGHWSFGASS
jgi:hypothetical protein